jgi:hypothetical protein
MSMSSYREGLDRMGRALTGVALTSKGELIGVNAVTSRTP